MRYLLLAAGLCASLAVQAQELGQSTTAIVYWQRTLGAVEKKDSVDAFGFRIDRTHSATGILTTRKPIADIRFSEGGNYSLKLRDFVLYQSQPQAAEAPPSVNWWIVGGLVAGSALVIADEERRARKQQDQRPCTPTLGPGGIIICI